MGSGSSGLGGAGGGSNNIMSKINALTDIGAGSLRTPIKTTDRSEGIVVQNLWSDANLSNKQILALPTQTVDVSDLYSWQRVVQKNGLLNMLKSDTPHSSDMPIAVRYNGKLVLVDGNHRAALALLRGDKSIKIRVYGG